MKVILEYVPTFCRSSSTTVVPCTTSWCLSRHSTKTNIIWGQSQPWWGPAHHFLAKILNKAYFLSDIRSLKSFLKIMSQASQLNTCHWKQHWLAFKAVRDFNRCDTEVLLIKSVTGVILDFSSALHPPLLTLTAVLLRPMRGHAAGNLWDLCLPNAKSAPASVNSVCGMSTNVEK